MREFLGSPSIVVLHQASLIHLCLQVPASVPVIVLFDEDKSRFAPRWLRFLQRRQIRRLYRSVIGRSSLVVFLTEAEREYALRLAGVGSTAKTRVVPLGIDMDVFSKNSIDNETSGSTPRCDVGVFGGVTYERRARPILSALETAAEKGYT